VVTRIFFLNACENHWRAAFATRGIYDFVRSRAVKL